MEQEEELTGEEIQMLQEAAKNYGSPQAEEKHSIHTFLNKVANSLDTTKTGNLTSEEIGFTPYSLRTYKKLAVDSIELCDDEIWANYFKNNGEILTSTSLSKEAKLISLAVLQRRELADMTTRPRKPNSGWFKQKEKPAEGVE